MWVDVRVSISIKGGSKINCLYEYRLSVLRNGMIALQESKFLCDLLENSFRNIIIKHFTEYNITYDDLMKYLPESSFTTKMYKKKYGAFEMHDLVLPSFIMSLTLYQITEIISRKWKVYNQTNYIHGFKLYFRTNKSFLHNDLFLRDLNYIRKQRNKSAHSNTLISRDELTKTYKICKKWLTPLHVNIDKEISLYRAYRPNFLL